MTGGAPSSPPAGVGTARGGNHGSVPRTVTEEAAVLVYQSRNSPGWGRVQPHAFGFESDDDEIDLTAMDVRPQDPDPTQQAQQQPKPAPASPAPEPPR